MRVIFRAVLFLFIFSLGPCQSTFAALMNIANGNLFEEQNVSPLPKLPVTIAYNSRSSRESLFGYGWNASFDIRLLINSDGSCVLVDSDGTEELFTPAANNTFTASADVHETLEKVVDTYRLNRKGGGYVGFDSKGLPLEIVDKNGNATTLLYSSGKYTVLTGPTGEQINVTTDSNGRITALAGAGKSTTFAYDSSNNLITITDPAGQRIQYTYDANHNRITKTNPAGQTSTYTYDSNDRLTSSQNSAGETGTFEYPSPTESRFIDAQGNATEYTTNSDQHVVQKKNAEGNTTAFTWDEAGNRTAVTDASGTVTMNYDQNGNLLTKTDQLGQTIYYTYDVAGHVLSSTDHAGRTHRFTYDASGNLLTATDPMGHTTGYAYDSQGHITAITDAQGRATTLSYDGTGNVIQVTDPTGVQFTMDYDVNGNMVSMTDADGNSSRFTYDILDRLLTVTDSKGGVASFQYDSLDNRTTVIDANGKTTRYLYDHQQRITRIVDALDQATEITYLTGSKSLPASLTDANGNNNHFVYDALGRLVQESDPLGNLIDYQYDAKGNLISRTDAKGYTIFYQYDSLGRLLRKIYPDGSDTAFEYDAAGNLVYAGNQHIAYAINHDALGRLASVTDSNERVIGYHYDASGNRVQMTMPDGETVQYSYNAANRLTKIASFLGNFDFIYDALGRRLGLAYPNGIATGYSYDAMGLLTGIISKHSGRRGETLINALNYTHDAVGNRLRKTMTDDDRNFGFGHRNHHNTKRYDYTYDAVYQLIEAQAVREGRQREKELRNRSEEYTYDAVGNRITGPRWNDFYTHNAANQMLTSGRLCYQYDADGNLIAKGDWAYEYDFENRLLKATKSEGHETKTISFKYDPFGRRIEKRVDESESGRHHNNPKITTYTYVYDNEDIILEIRTDSNEDEDHHNRERRRNHDHKPHSIVSRFVHGPDIDEPLAMERGGRISYYHADGLGSIINLTDQQGRVVQSYEYDTFGNMQHLGGEVTQYYTYTGREWDKELDLYYYRARYYDPIAGRFNSKDPIGFGGGDINLYRYVQNNPINFIDPLGLYWFRQSWQKPGTVGREGTIVPPAPEGAVSDFIEAKVPAGYTFGQLHDALVGGLTGMGYSDSLVNIPTMLPMYWAAQYIELLRSLGIVDQPQPHSDEDCK